MKRPFKRVCSLLLTLAMMISLAVMPASAEIEPTVEVRIHAVTEDGTETGAPTGFFEVSLAVTSAPQGKRNSVSGMLQYNTSKLKLMDWGSDSAITLSATPKAASTMASGEVAGKYSMAYQPTSSTNAYVYFSAQTGDTLRTNRALVSLRFKAVETVTRANITALLTVANLCAVSDATFESIKGSFPNAVAPFALNLNNATYYISTTRTGYSKLTADVNYTPTYGASQYGTGGSGKGSVDDFCSVVFYDWDGTLLGTRVVAMGGSLRGDHNTPDQRGDEPEQAPMPPEYNLLLDKDGDGVYDKADGDIANKMGYIFAGWVDYETGYSVPNVAAGAAKGAAIDPATLVSLDGIEENLILKAAYSEDATKLGDTTGARDYAISYSPFVLRDGSLETVITVMRPETARRAVNGEVCLFIGVRPKGLPQVKVRIPVGAADVETTTFSMPTNGATKFNATQALNVYLLDLVGAGNARSAKNFYIKAAEIAAAS